MAKSVVHKDYTGYKFNMLTVCELVNTKPTRTWRCTCECGNSVIVYEGNIGRQKSCGCIKAAVARANGAICKKHGETRTRLYRIWESLRRRCFEVSNKDYKRYGGRGITVCEAWLEYTNFRDWAVANGYAENLSIDRIDVNGNYCPENCRWADDIQQCNNRRSNHRIEYNGESHTIAEWSRIKSIPPKTLRYRIVNGWSVESALNTIVTKSNTSLQSRLARAI